MIVKTPKSQSFKTVRYSCIKKIRSFAILNLTMLLMLTGCKKENSLHEKRLDTSNGQIFNLKTSSIFGNYVSYNSNYDVLVFSDFEDVENLENALDSYDRNFPFNRGNDQQIFNTLDNIIQYGWTNGNNPNTDKVRIGDFKQLLDDSYPLSDTVLKEVLRVHDLVNPSFSTQLVKPVFVNNAPFSSDIITEIQNSALPNGHKSQILLADENSTLVPNHTFDDFLAAYPGYNSLYTNLEENAKNQLESGMDPADPNYDNDIIRFDYERLILNSRREIYIKDYLIRIYDSCKYAVFQGSIEQAYAELALLDGNGGLTTPTLQETELGLPLSVIGQSVPLNGAILSADQLGVSKDPRTGESDINLNEIGPVDFTNPFCPGSHFTYIKDTSVDFRYEFDSYTFSNYQGGSYMQYWDFGDGTGSFQRDPVHVYQNEGVCEVKLTTFNSDCGCWNVNKSTITVGDLSKSCDIVVYGTAETFGNNYTYNLTFYVNNYSASFVNTITVNFGDGTSAIVNPVTSNIYAVQHSYPSISGNLNASYTPSVEVTLTNGCTHTFLNPFGTFPTQHNSNNDCCDRKDKYKEKDETIFGGNAKLKIKDKINGKPNWTFSFYCRGVQDFYIKKSNGNWKKKKADEHKIAVNGDVNEYDNGCFSTPLEISGSNREKNAKDCKTKVTFNKTFGLGGDDVITMSHFVEYNGQTITLYQLFGDCP